MPRNAGTGVYTRVVNSFSQPVFGTLIDPTDADAYFDDLDVGLNPPQIAGPVTIVGALTATSGAFLGVLTNTLSQNTSTVDSVSNVNAGTAALAGFQAVNVNGVATFGVGGANYTGFSGLQNRSFVFSQSTLNGIAIWADGANPINFYNNASLSGAFSSAGVFSLTTPLAAGSGGTGLSALGTGVATALGINVGSAGAFVTFGGTLGPNQVTRANEVQGVARSVIGVTGNATANVADIQGTASQFLGINSAGTALAFQTMSGDATMSGPAITIAANAITNAKLATMAAFTFKGNNTSGTAVPTDVDIAALTSKASPAATDLIILSDQAASGAWKKATVSSVASAGAVATVNGQTGAVVSYFPPQGRLTLVTATPVMTTTQSAKGTIFYTPYVGNMVPIYDGTNMVPTAVAEISVLTTDATKSPAALGSSKVNDWFVWNDAGTIRIGHGPDWTNDTTRSAGTALVMVNGILLNNASITNGPAASRGTYVGTTRSDSGGTLNFIFGASASGGTAGLFGVWNMYNRRLALSTVIDTGTLYTYTSATIRQARASAGNQTQFVSGLAEDAIAVKYPAKVQVAGILFAAVAVGVGLDSTSSFNTTQSSVIQNPTAAAFIIMLEGGNIIAPQIGFHVLSANEASDGTNASSFDAGASNPFQVAIWN